MQFFDIQFTLFSSPQKTGFMPTPRPTIASQAITVAREKANEKVFYMFLFIVFNHFMHLHVTNIKICASTTSSFVLASFYSFIFISGSTQALHHEALSEH
jgi:hypothetical protein